jgi:hypothetical protein
MYKSLPATKKRNRRDINISQNEFSKGYISTISNSRRPINSLSDMTNIELTQDNIPRPRPPLIRYGTQPANTIIGRGKYRYGGYRGLLFMMNVGGVGKIYRQTDGGAFTLIGGANAYTVTAWSSFVQSKDRVYVYNGVDNLSYVNLATMATVEYTELGTPDAPTCVAAAGLISGTKYLNYYYKVTANNVVGESAASAASTAVNVNKPRDEWTATDSVTVSFSALAGADSYTIYGGSAPENSELYEIVTLKNLTTLQFVDDGSLTLNPFKNAPGSNSTKGAVFTWMYVDARNAQVFGTTADNKLYYSAPGTGDFSALNGGGWTTIDEGGDTTLNFVDGFRTGKGDPVITVSSRGSSGKGKLSHVSFDSATYGDQVFLFPNVLEANGQSGTYAPRATVKAKDSLYYPTGDAFKSTGTSQNIVNILTTSSIAQVIEPDVNKISLGNLYKAVGVEYQDKIYYALPVGSTENNEIWTLDLSRKNAWALRWPVAAKDLWLYEDNSGTSHFCALVNNIIMEFTRAGSQTTVDDGVAFSTRCAYSSLVWDKDGISLGNVNNQYFKLLQPKGNIQANTYGLSKQGISTNTGSDTYSVSVSFTGYDEWLYDESDLYDDDPGSIDTVAKSVAVLTVRPKGLLNQLDWEILTEDAGCDYMLSSVSTRGKANVDLIYKGVG